MFGRRLCLSYEMKEREEKKKDPEKDEEKRRQKKEGENLRPLGALLLTLRGFA